MSKLHTPEAIPRQIRLSLGELQRRNLDRRCLRVGAVHVNEHELGQREGPDEDHGAVGGVFEHGEVLRGLLLKLASLSQTVHVVVGLSLLVQEDGPALQIGVEFEHDQDET